MMMTRLAFFVDATLSEDLLLNGKSTVSWSFGNADPCTTYTARMFSVKLVQHFSRHEHS